MIFKFEAQAPKIDEKAYAFNTATLIGKVELKEYASVWPGVTIRGDVNRIEVGRYSNIQDNSVLHVADKYAMKKETAFISPKNGYEELMRINDEGEKTIIYLKRNKNKEKEFVLMSQEKNEFTIIAITGNLTLQEIQGIINKE